MRDVRALDSVSFTDWFKSHGGSQGSIDKMWCAPVAGRGSHGVRDQHLWDILRSCSVRDVLRNGRGVGIPMYSHVCAAGNTGAC